MTSLLSEQLVQFGALGTCLLASMLANFYLFKWAKEIIANANKNTVKFTELQSKQTELMRDIKGIMLNQIKN